MAKDLCSGPEPPGITVDGNLLDAASNFVYLGSLQCSDGCCTTDIRRRISLAASVMSSLDNIWKDRRLSTLIKIRAYLTLVQSVLLYASEPWTFISADSRSFDAFHMKCQHQILGISWQQFVCNEEVRAQTGLSSILDIISRRCISIFRHIARLQDSVLAHKALAVHVSSSLGQPPDSSW